jgi:uracil-DNA glycosylase
MAQLDSLLAEIGACRICRDQPEGTRLPHEPRPVLQVSQAARILIAGQAPGTRVHASGRPFTDPSGERLRAWLGIGPDIFYDPAKIAILPMGFCFPGLDMHGGDLPPRPECAPAWREKVMALLPNIEVIAAIGLYAHRYHINSRGSVRDTVANWRQWASGMPKIYAMPHPSWRNTVWLKSNPWFEREVLPELKREIAERL